MTPCRNCAGTEYERECRCEEEVIDVARKERHKLAFTKVEVFRLFKARDLALAVSKATDPVVRELGEQMQGECELMLKPYCTEQQRIINCDRDTAAKKQAKGLLKRLHKADRRVKAGKVKVKWPKSRRTAAFQRDRR